MNPILPKPGTVKRRAIAVSQDQLVKESPLQPGSALPLVIEPATQGVNLADWVTHNKSLVEAKLLEYGAILFRAFNIRSIDAFEQFMIALSGTLLEYSYRSTPRAQISGRIYTSTEYPAHQTISLHNEMSYTRNWPMLLGFCCVEPATEGGQTPIADSRKVFARIPAEVRERFARSGVMYIRNYGAGLDLPWQDVFQTTDRPAVEQYCHSADIGFEWQGDQLRTWQTCQAIAKHPQTGEMVWFNQAHLFHISGLDPELRASLLSAQESEPRNAFYGDGSMIEDSVLDLIRAAYESEAIVFSWEKGDVLVVDNMLTAHGRRPYRGPRRIVVGMARAFAG